MNLISDIIITSLGFVVFAALHSILAHPSVKQKMFDIRPVLKSYYRFLYSVIALVTLGIWFIFSPFPDGLLYDIIHPWSLFFRVVQIGGVVGFFLSIGAINLNEFIGLSRLLKRGTTQSVPGENQELVTDGIYGWVRHPLYSSTVTILLFNPTMSNKLALITLLTLLYCWIGAIFEERNLIKQYGINYIRYQKKVPRFIPKIKLF